MQHNLYISVSKLEKKFQVKTLNSIICKGQPNNLFWLFNFVILFILKQKFEF